MSLGQCPPPNFAVHRCGIVTVFCLPFHLQLNGVVRTSRDDRGEGRSTELNRSNDVSMSDRESSRRRGSRLSKTIVDFWLECALLVTFLLLCWISAVVQFLFPSGRTTIEWTLWGANVGEWRNAQFYTLCVLAFGILLHVMLHWSWIMGVVTTRFLGRKTTQDNGSHTLPGVGLLFFLLHMLAIGLL